MRTTYRNCPALLSKCVTWTAVAAVGLVSTVLCAAALDAAESRPVLVVPAAEVALQVAVPLPAGMKLKPAGAWQLVEVDKPETIVPAQLVTATAADGSAGHSGGRLVAAIPPRRGAKGSRRFCLEPAEASGGQASQALPGLHFKPQSDKSLGLWDGRQPVLVYNHGVITKGDIPQSDSRRRRGCYVHPVWGLNGEVLTADFPRDHYHHHGIFWAWPYVGIEGKEYNLWEYRDIQPKFVRWICRETGPVAAVLAVENGWFIGDKKVMIERVWLRAYRASDQQRPLDLEFAWIPVDKPVSLRGRGRKSYGGLTMRFDVHPRRDGIVTVPSGSRGHVGNSVASKTDLVNTPLPWADLTSNFPGAPARSGAAVFVHPRHPDYPPTWLTRCYGCLCVGWPGVKGQTFAPGEPIRTSYRIWIHKAAVGVEELKQAYAGYTAATKVKWE